ncbi:MAG TPA: POTRA domain-containing protein [Candidatus Kapabacteria bacterium]|nr:POTRA domain-containing protein [Candidatus Kapabacteria bacterium]
MFLTCSAALSAPWGSGAPPDSILTASSLRDSLRYPLRDIKIYGNRITKDKIILHELPVHLGDTLTEEQVRESQQRVYNIGLFNSADVVLWNDTLTRSAIMYIVVSERWYIFPQIILGVKDRGWTDIFTKGSKLYGGLAGVDYNFLGLNEKLYAGGVLGYDPWADLEYDRIALNRDQTLLLDLSLSTSRTLNQSDTLYTQGLSFNEISYNATGQMHWRVNQRLTVSGTAGFQSLHLSNPNARLTLNPSGNDNSPLVSVSIAYDSRDVVEYPMFGTWFQMSLSRTGFDQYIHYENFSIDLRRYIPTWWGISFCFRAATTLSYDGTDPVYNHVFLGLNERVRGDFFTKREGEDLAIGSAEIRIPLLAPRIYKWSTAPRYLPEQFTIWKFGIYATLFADAGVPWFRDQRLADQQWSNGAGAGIDLLFPYGIVTRFEYAIGTVKGQFIFDVGASF